MQDRRGVGFIANCSFAPNLDAVRYLIQEIMPRVWREDPSIECVLAGSAMAAEIKGRTPGIVLLDAASDLATVFERVRQELDITVRQYPVTFDTNDAC